MLVDFSIENYLSFKKKTYFSMVADTEIHYKEENVVNLQPEEGILKTSVIYGPNGSGKSNLILSLETFKNAITLSLIDKEWISQIHEKRFKLDKNYSNKPTFFEMKFTINKILYRYGFQVGKNGIEREWLYKYIEEEEINLFERNELRTKINKSFISFSEQEKINKLSKNILLLTYLSEIKIGEVSKIYSFFDENFILSPEFSTKDNEKDKIYNLYFEDKEIKKKVDTFMQFSNLGIKEVKKDSTELNILNSDLFDANKTEFADIMISDDLNNKLDKLGRKSYYGMHEAYNSSTKKSEGEERISFENESSGSRNIFLHSIILFEILKRGGVVILDEFGSTFHSQLSHALLELFNNPYNEKSQLIVASHDTSLMRMRLFRKDQIWFTEKNKDGDTELYSLIEFKPDKWESLQQTDSYLEDEYLKGKYGAVPYCGDIKKLLADLF